MSIQISKYFSSHDQNHCCCLLCNYEIIQKTVNADHADTILLIQFYFKALTSLTAKSKDDNIMFRSNYKIHFRF